MLARSIAVVAPLLLCSAAQAVWIYAPDNMANKQPGVTSDNLIRFDSSNPLGTVQTIGNANIPNAVFAGLEFVGSSLYGVTGLESTGIQNKLYQFNTTTGAASLVGSLNLPAGYYATDLAYDPVTHEMLGLATNNVFEAPRTRLFSVNTTTGASQDLGMLSATEGAGMWGHGLGVSSTGQRYMFELLNGWMYTISGTTVNWLPNNVGFMTDYSQGMTIDWAHDNTWYYGYTRVTYTTSWVETGRYAGLATMNYTSGSINSGNVDWPSVNAFTPQFETGDLAIQVPEPTSIALLAIPGLWLMRRRNNSM